MFNSISHSWAIELNTQWEIPYLSAPMCYSLWLRFQNMLFHCTVEGGPSWKCCVRIVCGFIFPASSLMIFEKIVTSKTAVENRSVIEEHLEFSNCEREVQRVGFKVYWPKRKAASHQPRGLPYFNFFSYSSPVLIESLLQYHPKIKILFLL